MGWVKDKATELIEKHKTNDPFEIAALENIFVFDWDLDDETLGFYKYIRRNKFIFLNRNLDHYQKRYVCSHELGHATLHPNSNTPFLRANTFFSINKIEVEANTFAVALLLSGEVLQNYETKEQILKDNGIPVEMERFL